MGQVNKFHRWLSLTSRDIRITWRFEVKIPHKAKRTSFIGLREELSQTILTEVSVLNSNYSKQRIRVHWMANWQRQDCTSKFEYEKLFRRAARCLHTWKPTSGSSYTYKYDHELCYFLFKCFSVSFLSQ